MEPVLRDPVDFGAFAGAAASLPASAASTACRAALTFASAAATAACAAAERGLRGGEIGSGLLLRLAGGGLRGGVSRVARRPASAEPDSSDAASAAFAMRALFASRSSTAALSERRRIFAAPRLETSSILSSVYTSALSARISATSIGGDGVEAAAERVELHELEARIRGHEVRGRVPGASGRPTGW